MITFIITLAILGLIVWALTTYIPMPQGIRTVIVIVGVIIAIVMALNFFNINLDF